MFSILFPFVWLAGPLVGLIVPSFLDDLLSHKTCIGGWLVLSVFLIWGLFFFRVDLRIPFHKTAYIRREDKGLEIA